MSTSSQTELASRLRELQRPGQPLLIPNPWDAGSAQLLTWLGFEALATTSSGSAATLGLLDGSLTAAQALQHAAEIVSVTDVPVSADLEDGFADSPEGVAATAQAAVQAGLAGFSIEDCSGGSREQRIYECGHAAERVAAAAEVAHRGSAQLVVTARAENHLHGRDDLGDTIERLLAYQAAGADVLYAPGLIDAEQIRSVVSAVDRPVNVLAMRGAPSVAQLAELGVARISVGGAFAYAAIDALVRSARELREQGTYGFTEYGQAGARVTRAAFARPPIPGV